MIISASRRTDIPAFFGEWFMHRVREGFVYRQNPYNPRQVKRFSLCPETVQAIVFWSKDPRPFMPSLPTLDDYGFGYYFQFTLNDYPTWIEPLAPLEKRIKAFWRLAELLGPDRVCWRYDPIILTPRMSVEYHMERLAYLAQQVGPYTSRLTVSWLDYYAKTKRRLEQAAEKRNETFLDLDGCGQHGQDLGRFLKQVTDRYGLQLVTCAEHWGPEGSQEGSCIDGRLLKKIFGCQVPVGSDPGQRQGCRCSPSVDVGAYDTCGHLCLYCYAHRGERAVARRWARYRVEAPGLAARLDEERPEPQGLRPGSRIQGTLL